uniref:Alpha-1-microglobulin/bikunin n=1 Tax=Gopherus evgoodei TaxID=1825980 RepID=A0A8C4W9I4_9SAUR
MLVRDMAIGLVQGCNVQLRENKGLEFEPSREGTVYGKWYDIATGTTCKWMKQYKDKFNMGTLVLGPGMTSNQISTTSTRLRQGVCTQVSGEYQKTDIPGKYTYYNPSWDVTINSYVVHTNYEEYAIILMQKKSSFGLTITAKLYGRSPELREGLIVDFRQFAQEMGIPEDSIFIMINKGRENAAWLCDGIPPRVPPGIGVPLSLPDPQAWVPFTLYCCDRPSNPLQHTCR